MCSRISCSCGSTANSFGQTHNLAKMLSHQGRPAVEDTRPLRQLRGLVVDASNGARRGTRGRMVENTVYQGFRLPCFGHRCGRSCPQVMERPVLKVLAETLIQAALHAAEATHWENPGRCEYISCIAPSGLLQVLQLLQRSVREMGDMRLGVLLALPLELQPAARRASAPSETRLLTSRVDAGHRARPCPLACVTRTYEDPP